ncbi:hypothetical protein CW306_01100 [Bacillus sp. BA3]|nr:hypothetical protein CW306_01100 [Bacillus sp. BA3]
MGRGYISYASYHSVPLVKDINFELKKRKVLGLVGESGSGKTVTSMSILLLLDRKTTTIEGSITIRERNLTGLDDKEMREIQGKYIAFIMQNPMNAFTPVFTIGNQFVETIRSHTSLNKKQAKELAIDAIKNVNLPNPAKSLKSYHFQLSGGMLQRVMIALLFEHLIKENSEFFVFSIFTVNI